MICAIIGVVLLIGSFVLIAVSSIHDDLDKGSLGCLGLFTSIALLMIAFIPDKDEYKTIECQEYKVENIYSVIDKDTVTTYKIYYK